MLTLLAGAAHVLVRGLPEVRRRVSGPALQQPPHSTESERALLGAVLLHNAAFDRASWLNENAFYADQHRRVWRCIVRMIEAGRAVDLVTVCEELGADLEKAGGAAYLGGMMQNTPGVGNVARYAQLIYEKSVQRELCTIATEIAEAALAPVVDVRRMLDEAESKIFRIAERTARRGEGPVDITPFIARVYEHIDSLHHQPNNSGVTGLPSGFVDLDQKTAGFHPGDLIVVAGRPSMGKTAFALNIAEHVAVDLKLPVVIFSMEMSGAQLASRMLGSIGMVDQHRMRTGKLDDDAWGRLTEAMGRLHERPIQIDESGSLTALELRARARRVKRRFPKLGLVIVDYLQLMEAKERGENRATDIAEITRSLKAMAKELDCPVMALSQLSRRVDERPDKRPQMGDLRESGAIEQDADVILAIYRDVVYHPDVDDEAKRIAELLLLKQRNGPTGTVPLLFMGHLTRFQNYANADGSPWHPRRGVTKAAKRSVVSVDFKSQAAGDS